MKEIGTEAMTEAMVGTAVNGQSAVSAGRSLRIRRARGQVKVIRGKTTGPIGGHAKKAGERLRIVLGGKMAEASAGAAPTGDKTMENKNNEIAAVDPARTATQSTVRTSLSKPTESQRE